MPVHLPERRAAVQPLGALRASPFHAGKRGLSMPLNLTAMVDMFSVIAIFLLQSFSANGDLDVVPRDVDLPVAANDAVFEARGTVIALVDDAVVLDGQTLARLSELDDADPGIPALRDRLDALRVADGDEISDRELVVQADAGTDFALIRRTVRALNDARWVHVRFAVRHEG